MNNKYFNDITIEQFHYFDQYPERRRERIVSDKSYDIYDKREHFKEIYDAGKLNAFIKVVNDKLYLATSWSNVEEKYVTKAREYISYRKPAEEINRILYKKIFHKGNFFNIEIFKLIITQGIVNNGIDQVIFKAMPYKFPVSTYKRSVKDADTLKVGKDYTVVISCHGKTICVAMWEHTLPYY